ncbi:MAG TPA: histidine phosphatase family protein, partial [Caldimonas sp.]
EGADGPLQGGLVMDLILWRHAEAVIERPDQDDLERALTPKGERHAQRMADWLNQRLAHSTRVLVSPALRCQQTARCLGRHFKTVAALGPGGDAEALLKAARWPDAAEPVLVIGHQPTLGLVAAMVLAELAQPWAVKKGAVWWLRNRDREGLAQVVLQAVQSPDCL